MEQFWIVLIVIAASLIKGITGFGFALVALPPLLIWYAPAEIIPVLVLSNLAASVMIIMQQSGQYRIGDKFISLIFWGAVFSLVGVMTLSYFRADLLIRIMSIFFITIATLSLVGVRRTVNPPTYVYRIAGSLFGFLTGSISVGGPPLALFLDAVNVSNQQFRVIFSWFSIVSSCVALVGYGISGMLTLEMFKTAALFLPVLFAGSYIGKRINQHVPVAVFKKIVLLVTLVASFFLLLK